MLEPEKIFKNTLSVLMIATTHLWLCKTKCKVIRNKVKIKNTAPQLHSLHFNCSVATRGWWLPYLTVQL